MLLFMNYIKFIWYHLEAEIRHPGNFKWTLCSLLWRERHNSSHFLSFSQIFKHVLLLVSGSFSGSSVSFGDLQKIQVQIWNSLRTATSTSSSFGSEKYLWRLSDCDRLFGMWWVLSFTLISIQQDSWHGRFRRIHPSWSCHHDADSIHNDCHAIHQEL